MNGYQQIKKQLLPLIQGAPIVIVVFIIALFLGKMLTRYSTTKYQSIAKIKLDDQKFGFSNNEIYKDFPMFSLEHRIEAEAELLKSPLIVSRAVDSLGISVEVVRVGKLKSTTLYGNSPIDIVAVETNNHDVKHYEVTISKEKNLTIKCGETVKKGVLNKELKISGNTILIRKSPKVEEMELALNGNYLIRFLSKKDLVAEICNRIDVKAPDKETPILRVAFNDKNSKRTADIVNAVCKAYIDDYVVSKSSAASQTVDFIDEQLAEIQRKLSRSERDLEVFKTNNSVVNTRQETETGLREISQLRVDMVNLEINERAMRDLQAYIDQGSYFDETAVNFGFGDLVLTELVKKLKFLSDERVDLTQKFTENSAQIAVVDKKILEVKQYIKEAVRRNLSDLKIRRREIEAVYDERSHMFDRLPTREKNQRILERDFLINESVYNFLSQKKIDASILANSMIAFHRIIQPAIESKEPVSPNRTLIKFVSGLLGLIIGIGFIYLRRFVSAKVISREDVEKNSTLPFAGIIRKGDKKDDFDMLFRRMLLTNNGKKILLGVCSANGEEGKSYVSENLAKVIKGYGYTCAVIRFGDREKDNAKLGKHQIARINMKLEDRVKKIADQYDFTIMIAPPSTRDILAVKVMQLATLNYYIVRTKHTGINYVREADRLVLEYKLENVEMLLNGAHKATNFNGQYVGTRFRSAFGRRTIKQRIKESYYYYFKS